MTVTAEMHSNYAAIRREPRERTVHLVEYSRYPRRLASEGRGVAYTQDRSASGLGLDLTDRVWPGELLQVTLRDIDGTASISGLARVVWSREEASGRTQAGLSMLYRNGERPMLHVRRTGTHAGN